MTQVSFHRLAERELNDAALYYERQSPGLGVRFLEEIQRYVEAIVKNPNAGRKIRGQVRRSYSSQVSIRSSLLSEG
jgi:plasmid stabilization system protein ParE